MVEREPRLGRGLESLIPRTSSVPEVRAVSGATNDSSGGTREIGIKSIVANPFQPRRDFEPGALNELVESLRSHGLLQPIVVRARAGGYQLVAGERRWRAAQELGWDTIRASVVAFDDNAMLEAALVENIQRENLNPIELGVAYREMQDTLHLTQDELARRVGKSRSSVANIMRLLDLPELTRARVASGTVSMGAARAMLSLPDEATIADVTERIAAGEMTVRQVEALSRKPLATPSAPRETPIDPNLMALAEELQQDLGTKVEIRGRMQRGRISIDYHSAAQLDQLVRALRAAAPEVEDPDDEETSITI